MRSVDTFWPPRVVVRSTTGLAPLTVTVSCSAPTFSEALMRAAKPALSSSPWTDERIESLQLETQLMGAARQVDEAVDPLCVSDRRELPHLQRRTGDRHRHAGQRGAGLIGDDAVDARRSDVLRRRGARGQ